MSTKYIYAIINFIAVLILNCSVNGQFYSDPELLKPGILQYQKKVDSENQEFRDTVINYVREIVKDSDYENIPPLLNIKGDWLMRVLVFHNGEKSKNGTGQNEFLYLALKQAVDNLMKRITLSDDQFHEARFYIQFFRQNYSVIEYEDKGLELIRQMVTVRHLDRDLMKKTIEESKEYLFRVIDKDLFGAHKFYYATKDKFEDRLHTIYTASLLFTLIRMNKIDNDPKISFYIDKCSNYLLAMQNLNIKSKHYGAFHYSYFTKTRYKELKYVVGTASKTIFTLLMLHERTGNEKFLMAAKLAADWLLTMQQKNGSMQSYAVFRDQKWHHSKLQSFLYNGQVLSALSRIYRVTNEQSYFDAAKNLSEYVINEIDRQGCYVGDEYRGPNPISTSWAILSLFDFYLASDDERYLELIKKCTDDLLTRQKNDSDDIFRYGRWTKSLSSSGNGWLMEVLSELYLIFKERGIEGGEKYKEPIAKCMRWCSQYVYTDENSFITKNKDRANGGIYWNRAFRYVRTDSVCHGINAFVNMVNEYEDGPILIVPERPIYEILGFSVN